MQEKGIDREIFEVITDVPVRLFNEDKMYTYIKTFCTAKELFQTVKVLPYVRQKHDGQFRKSVRIFDDGSTEKIPYINHPLLMACHGLSLGFLDDDLISALLLHDVCEDCGVLVEDLPVNENTQMIVSLVTKTDDFHSSEEGPLRYYKGISENTNACIVKVLDRCNNLSGMTSCFTDKHMAEYIIETEEYILPLLEKVSAEHPEKAAQMFLLKYHINSLIDSIRHYMARKLLG